MHSPELGVNLGCKKEDRHKKIDYVNDYANDFQNNPLKLLDLICIINEWKSFNIGKQRTSDYYSCSQK